MQHVLRTTTSASSSPSAAVIPSASSSPAMRSESCSFIWHPKVRTRYRRPDTGPEVRAGTRRCPVRVAQPLPWRVAGAERAPRRAEKSSADGYRYGEVLQLREGVRLHLA